MSKVRARIPVHAEFCFLIVIYEVLDEYEFESKCSGRGGIIVDVKDTSNRFGNMQSNVISIDLFKHDFSSYFYNIKREVPILVYTLERAKSKSALRMLEELGFKDLFELKRNA